MSTERTDTPSTTAPRPLPVRVPDRQFTPWAPTTDWQQLAGAWLLGYSSAHTRDAYRRDLAQFARYLDGHLGIPDPLQAPRPAVLAYARHLDDAGHLTAATRARKLAAVASFYGHAVADGVLGMNPAANVRRPRVSADSPRLGLSADEARAVVAAAVERSAAHRALVALCMGVGLRVSEALSVTPAAITTVGGHRVVAVTGKGGKARQVPLSPQVLALLDEALDGCPDGVTVVRDEAGRPVDRHRALRMIGALGRAAGVPGLRPHDCRHTAATLALDNGAPIHRVQDVLGHSSPTTTMRYVRARERLDHSAAYVIGQVLAG